MTFSNQQVPLNTLPRFSEVEFQSLHPSYARVVLGVTMAFQAPLLLAATIVLFLLLEPDAGMRNVVFWILYALVVSLLILLAWFFRKSASVIRYAIRDHDVIVHSGVFWKKETVQPIRRIQHVEQHQGPVDKRFGLYELKLFSAGTGHFTFRIPGLDAKAASSIKRFILDVQQDDWAEDFSGPNPTASPEQASGSGETASPPREADARDADTKSQSDQTPGAAEAVSPAQDAEGHEAGTKSHG